MPDCKSQVAAVIGRAPEDLLVYCHTGSFPNYPDSRINCLPFDKARDSSQMMRGISAVGHDDFFVREAFAVFLAGNPSFEDCTVAKQLATDRHPQVTKAGKAAVAAAASKGHNEKKQ